MAGSVNKVILIGNLGKDPEVRHLESGASLARFSLATSESYNDRNTGERVTQTEWHNVVVWRGLAKIAEQYLKKGSKIFVEGKLRTRSWQDQTGNTRYTTEIVADNLTMLDKPANLGGMHQSQHKELASIDPAQMEATSDNFNGDDDLPF